MYWGQVPRVVDLGVHGHVWSNLLLVGWGVVMLPSGASFIGHSTVAQHLAYNEIAVDNANRVVAAIMADGVGVVFYDMVTGDRIRTILAATITAADGGVSGRIYAVAAAQNCFAVRIDPTEADDDHSGHWHRITFSPLSLLQSVV